jgi:hypothetical protein
MGTGVVEKVTCVPGPMPRTSSHGADESGVHVKRSVDRDNPITDP